MDASSFVRVLPKRDHCGFHIRKAFGDTDPKLQEELNRLCHFRIYRAGETVIGEAEEVIFVGSVISGVLRVQKSTSDGRQQIVGLLLPSDLFGRVFARTSEVAIEAVTDAALCCFHRSAFERLLARFPELEHRMLLAILTELDGARDWMLLLGSKTVPERIASFLLLLDRRYAEQMPPGARRDKRLVKVPVRRRDVAAYLGTTVETISRIIQGLARKGVIRIVDPQRFEILNEARLVRASGHGEQLDGGLSHEEGLRRRA